VPTAPSDPSPRTSANEEWTILAGEANGACAGHAERGDQPLVGESGERHAKEIDVAGRGDAASADEGGDDSGRLLERSDLVSAAVHDAEHGALGFRFVGQGCEPSLGEQSAQAGIGLGHDRRL